MRTIHLQPEVGDEVTLDITEPADAYNSQDRHLHFVFPSAVCPDIETLISVLDERYTVTFEPETVSLPKLSSLGAQLDSGEVLERLFEVIDAPVLAEIGLIGAPGLPEAIFQKTSLKKIAINSSQKRSISIPDSIRNLSNLEHFQLFDARVPYLSPEIFRLPRIRHISLYRLLYEPSPEVMAAAEAFVAAGGCLDQPYGNGPINL